MNKKNNLKIINTVFSWIFLLVMLAVLISSFFTMLNSRNSGESNFIFGYRLICLTSGSMEPTIKTHGMALTKEVDSLTDIKENDIISYHLTTASGELVRVTHRVYSINDAGEIITKGDNNEVVDAAPITIENVESKVCIIFNFTAWIYDKWNSGISGKILLVSISICFILGYFCISCLLQNKNNQHNKSNNAVSNDTNLEQKHGDNS